MRYRFRCDSDITSEEGVGDTHMGTKHFAIADCKIAIRGKGSEAYKRGQHLIAVTFDNDIASEGGRCNRRRVLMNKKGL